jgi:hypothetical protein
MENFDLRAPPTDDNYHSNLLTTMTMFERPDAFGMAVPPEIIPQELQAKFGYPAGSLIITALSLMLNFMLPHHHIWIVVPTCLSRCFAPENPNSTCDSAKN